MIRIILVAAGFISVIGIIVTLWITLNHSVTPKPVRNNLTAPQQFDTTGGQEMRPRWNQGEGQDNDATSK